jgi:pimeloyl-ACP methyl ester carboxylesterase
MGIAESESPSGAGPSSHLAGADGRRTVELPGVTGRHPQYRSPDRLGAWSVAALAVILLVLVTPVVSRPGQASPASAVSISVDGILPGAVTVYNVSYTSSVDGFPLSYAEILPAGYTSAHSWPLLVYMHGEGTSSAWVRGGAGNGLTNAIKQNTEQGLALRAMAANASADGFIIIAPSPRSAEGFYTNSPCGGPEQQDTMDAILHEEALRNVSSIYLLGFSMGSLAALSFAGHYPGLVKGVAVAGSVTDAFQETNYHPKQTDGLNTLVCGHLPSTGNATSIALYSYLSVLRFDPENFSGIKIWMSAGGKDTNAPDNPAIYKNYLQANDTMLTYTCSIAKPMNEPANCTQPFANLTAAQPSNYSSRFVYEALGEHLLDQFDMGDVFGYWLGTLGSGCYDANFPPTNLIACP